VAAGYVVSVPPRWQLANVVLVALYTFFVGASILLVIGLWRERLATKASR